MKISGIAKYFAVYLGSWRNFIWEVGGEEVVWNRGLNRSREGIQQQGGAHVRQHNHCFPPEYAFQMTSNIHVSLQMVERAC